MPVISPARYQPRPEPKKRRPYARIVLALLVLIGASNYLRPVPAPTASLSITVPTSTSQPSFAWPSEGQAAVAAAGYGLLGTSGAQKRIATASIAKVITALCVLQKQPLSVGQSGPTYTISNSDMDIYQHYLDVNGSLVDVQLGEHLSEYQALEALLVPSANNIADSLVNWVFGSHAAYVSYATTYLQQHGLNETQIGSDASGFEPDTTSTASDLTNLGLLALKSPVLLQIASERRVTLPVVGTVANYDTVLGQSGIIGLKTGNNDEDPGAFLFAARHTYAGKDILITGAVMGMSDLQSALDASTAISDAVQGGFQQVTLVRAGQVVGQLRSAWGETEPIAASSDVQLVQWRATPLRETQQLKPAVGASDAGSLKVSAGTVSSTTRLHAARPLAGPSFWWRLTRH